MSPARPPEGAHSRPAQPAASPGASALRRRLVWALPAALAACAGAPVGVTPGDPRARVMLLGLFHFANPGLDAVKYQPLDVMQPEAQAYLEALAQRLAGFAPTRVLLEYPQRSDAVINQRYADHLAGRFVLPRNEIYQLGFRVARLAGHTRVHGFDEPAPPGGDTLWKVLPEQAPQTHRRLMQAIAAMSERQQREHRTLSLREILLRSNSPEEDNLNKGFYLLLNDVGAESRQFHGADASAHWWHRNLRMYAVVQSHAGPGERVLAIAGSGHTAVMRDLLRADGDRVEEPVRRYL